MAIARRAPTTIDEYIAGFPNDVQEILQRIRRVVREVAIGEAMTVGELAQKMAVKATEVIKVMMNMGVMATINQMIEQDTAV